MVCFDPQMKQMKWIQTAVLLFFNPFHLLHLWIVDVKSVDHELSDDKRSEAAIDLFFRQPAACHHYAFLLRHVMNVL